MTTLSFSAPKFFVTFTVKECDVGCLLVVDALHGPAGLALTFFGASGCARAMHGRRENRAGRKQCPVTMTLSLFLGLFDFQLLIAPLLPIEVSQIEHQPVNSRCASLTRILFRTMDDFDMGLLDDETYKVSVLRQKMLGIAPVFMYRVKEKPEGQEYL